MSLHADFRTRGDLWEVWCHDLRRWKQVIAWDGHVVCVGCGKPVDERLTEETRDAIRDAA